MTKVEAVHLFLEQEMPAIRRAEERYGFGEENMDSVMRRTGSLPSSVDRRKI